MKKILLIISLSISLGTLGQTEILKKYQTAEKLIQKDKILEAYTLLKNIEHDCDKKDTLYNYILWYYVGATTELEKSHRMNEKFDKSLEYGLEALVLIEKGKYYFDKKFAERKFWMHKNIIVSYFGLGQLDKAKEHQKILYDAYNEKSLPNGMDEFYNFAYFRWEDKNVWGYEWFEDLPEDRMSKSFSKIVYYIYSTNSKGEDKDQLYRLEVLMFHKIDTSIKFDYVLTKRLEKATKEISGTLISYTYDKEIDYAKLQADIKEVLKGNYESNATTTIKKK